MEYSKWEDPRIRGLSGIIFLSGIWLIITAFAFNYQSTAMTWNQVIAGIVIAILALVRYGVRSAVWASWLNVLASVWIIIATFALSLTTAARWCGFIGGIVALALALANTATPTETTPHNLHHGHPAM